MEASRPLDSDIRRAARPVGATSSTEAFCSLAAAQIRRIVAVLPVPGPPVTIESREANAARTAAACSGAGTRSSAGGAFAAFRLARRGGQLARRSRRGRARASPSRAGRPRPRVRRVVDLDDERAAVGHLAEARGVRCGAEQLAGAGGELGDRQAGRAGSLRLAQDVQHRRSRPRGRVGRDVDRARDRVRGLEPDAEHAREVVGALAHDAVGARAVVVLDAGDQPGEAVRREQEVQCPARAQLVPGLDRLADSSRAEAEAAERGARVAVDDLEHVLAVEVEQPLGSPAADVPHALEVDEQRGLARGRERLGCRDLDLQPVAAVVLPLAADADPLALLEVGERPHQRDLVAVAVGLDDREPRLVARPAEAPDEDLVLERRAGGALDHLGRSQPHSRCRSPDARAIGRSTAARTASSVPTSMRCVCARVTAV